MTDDPIVMFFGCIHSEGHMHWRTENMTWSPPKHGPYPHPWGGTAIDGCLQRSGLHQKDGWTAIEMTDYTVDDRPGSHAVLLAEGTFTQAELIERFTAKFPNVARRLKLASRYPAVNAPQEAPE